VAFHTTISRPAFTQEAGATWELRIKTVGTTSASPPSFLFEVEDGSTVIYSTSVSAPTISLTGASNLAIMDETIAATGSTTLTTAMAGTIGDLVGGALFNRTAQVSGFANSNTSETLSVLMQCGAPTAGDGVTLNDLELVRIN
jgi:hypothetical protein